MRCSKHRVNFQFSVETFGLNFWFELQKELSMTALEMWKDTDEGDIVLFCLEDGDSHENQKESGGSIGNAL